MKNVIEVKNLTKKYGKLTAVDNVSFEVRKGEIFGLLGENGAGKTTTLEIIEGLRKPTGGDVKILGMDIKKDLSKIKKRVGVQLQSSAYYHYLNLKEIIDLFCSFYGTCVESKELLDMVELGEKSYSYIGSLSSGQRQWFSIIASLVNDPEIIFLDEPTTGLDPLARRNLWEIIKKIKQQSKTIILTTHYMEEAELLCDHVAIMERGRILALNETHKLIERAKYPYNILFIADKVDKKIFEKITKLGPDIENIFAKQNHFEIKIDTKEKLDKTLKLIQQLKPDIFTVGKTTLEDVFIELTGKTIKE